VSGLAALIQLADTVARHLEKPARSSLEDIFGAMKLLELEDVWAGRLMTMAGDTEDAVPFPKGP
jgi:hypothetical protein